MNAVLTFTWSLILVSNTLWFGAAFVFFGVRSGTAAKLLVPRGARSSPLFQTVAASVRFLGGMNLSLSLFAAALVVLTLRTELFPLPEQHALFAGVFAIAHATQFYFNVPIARGGGRVGDALWDVLRGPMLTIFVVDATLMLANFAAMAALLMARSR